MAREAIRGHVVKSMQELLENSRQRGIGGQFDVVTANPFEDRSYLRPRIVFTPYFFQEDPRRESEESALLSDKSLTILHILSDPDRQNGLLNQQELGNLAEGYEDWRAVFDVVEAGWALQDPAGIVLTEEGRKMASRIFEDRIPNH